MIFSDEKSRLHKNVQRVDRGNVHIVTKFIPNNNSPFQLEEHAVKTA